jgi:hypothetical protein
VLWPVSDRATAPTEGLPYRGRPSVGGFGALRRPSPNAGRLFPASCLDALSVRHTGGWGALPLGDGYKGDGGTLDGLAIKRDNALDILRL